jgi:hypothetical protein
VQFIRKGACYLRHVMRANSTTNDNKGNSTSNAKTKKSKITTQISSKDPDSSTLQQTLIDSLSSTHSHQRWKHSSHDSTIKVKTSNIKPYLIRSRLDLRLLLATKPLTHLTYRASLFFSLLLFLPEHLLVSPASRWAGGACSPSTKSTVFNNTTEKRKKKKKKMENP